MMLHTIYFYEITLLLIKFSSPKTTQYKKGLSCKDGHVGDIPHINCRIKTTHVITIVRKSFGNYNVPQLGVYILSIKR